MMIIPQMFFIILGILLIIGALIQLLLFYKGQKNKSTHFPLMRGKSALKYRKWDEDNNPVFYKIGILKLILSATSGLIFGIIFIFVGLIFF